MSEVAIILKKDVNGLGLAGDQKKVKRGFAANYLIPHGLAIPFSKDTQNQIDAIRSKESKTREQEKAVALELLAKFNKKSIQLTAKVHDDGLLYGAVSVSELQSAIQDQLGVELAKKDIHLTTPIKEVGEHVVKITLPHDVTGSVTVSISPEAAE